MASRFRINPFLPPSLSPTSLISILFLFTSRTEAWVTDIKGDLEREERARERRNGQPPPFLRYTSIINRLLEGRQDIPTLDDWTNESEFLELKSNNGSWFRERAWMMRNVGECLDYVSRLARSEVDRKKSYNRAIQHWQVVREYVRWELDSNPSPDQKLDPILILKFRDYANSRWIDSKYLMATATGVPGPEAAEEALAEYLKLEANEIGKTVLRQWRTRLIECHGGPYRASRTSPDSADYKAWQHFMKAWDTYDALFKLHSAILPNHDPDEIDRMARERRHFITRP